MALFSASLGYLWTYSHPRGDVVFDWNVSRSREGPREFLKSFRGKLQTDGYGVYESLARERGEELILIGCWAHARRGFYEALGEGRRAAWIVGQIGLLYAVEKILREQMAGPELRAAVRAWQSRPSWRGCGGRWKSCGAACCPRVCWARPLTTRWPVGWR
jgi:transposase